MPLEEDIDHASVWSRDRSGYRGRRTQVAQNDTCDYCYQTFDHPGDRYELILPTSSERFYVHTVCSGPMRYLREATRSNPLGKAKYAGAENWRMFASTLNLPESPDVRTSTMFDADSARYLLQATRSGIVPLVHGFRTQSEAQAHYESHKAHYLAPCTAEEAAEYLRRTTKRERNRALTKKPKSEPDADQYSSSTASTTSGTTYIGSQSSSSSTLNRSRRSVFPAAVNERTRRGTTEGTWLYGCGGSM